MAAAATADRAHGDCAAALSAALQPSTSAGDAGADAGDTAQAALRPWAPLDADEAAARQLPEAEGELAGGCWWRYGSSDADAVSVSVLQCPEVGIGGRVWPVSVLLATELERRLASEARTRCRVLELGSGCGLVGLLLARLGHDVLLTDTPALQRLLSENVAANAANVAAASGRASAGILAWGDLNDARRIVAESGGAPFDLVVGADVTYLAHVRQKVMDTLSWVCGPNTLVVLAHAAREDETPERVVEALSPCFEAAAEPLAAAELRDPRDLGSKVREASVMLFRPRADALRASALHGDAEEEDDCPDGDRSASCSCCGGPMSEELRDRRGVCDACMAEF
eukprot:TRINITY_DN62747_c0_g1_i1.p1 TRINITY_DN62747_c0_g1~~TRINITY_DN62747_c0_g1_i1.p1  ORF type:complete len:341 (-),score=85.49 TRINITY_DN62747_c0_g1_i1:44-1066(-)